MPFTASLPLAMTCVNGQVGHVAAVHSILSGPAARNGRQNEGHSQLNIAWQIHWSKTTNDVYSRSCQCKVATSLGRGSIRSSDAAQETSFLSYLRFQSSFLKLTGFESNHYAHYELDQTSRAQILVVMLSEFCCTRVTYCDHALAVTTVASSTKTRSLLSSPLKRVFWTLATIFLPNFLQAISARNHHLRLSLRVKSWKNRE